MGLIFRPLSAAAVIMRPYATRLANSMKGTDGVRTRSQDGFLLRAVSKGDNVTVYVLELGGLIGGATGYLSGSYGNSWPINDRMVAFSAAQMGALSSAPNTAPVLPWRTFGKSGGVIAGAALTWDAGHHILSADTRQRATPTPSAVMYAVASGVSGANLAETKAGGMGPKANRSIIVHRLSAATQYTETYSGIAKPSQILRLNPDLNVAGKAKTTHIEINNSVIDLASNPAIGRGSSACLEWGANEGVVTYVAEYDAIPKSESVPSGATATYFIMNEFAPYSSDVMWRLEPGAKANHQPRIARYSVTEQAPDPQTGAVSRSAGILWSGRLDGYGAGGALESNPPAFTQRGEPSRWVDNWRWEDMQLWGEDAGYESPLEGEVLCVGTVLVRRFNPFTYKIVEVTAHPGTADNWTSLFTSRYEAGLMMVFDRHLVRTLINKAAGTVSYESLYRFENAELSRWNNVADTAGGFGIGFNGDIGDGWPLDTTALEGYTHRQLCGFTIKSVDTQGAAVLSAYVACGRVKTLHEVVPASYLWGGREGFTSDTMEATSFTYVPMFGDGGFAQLYHTDSSGNVIAPYEPGSPPFRDVKRNPSKVELADCYRVTVVGRTGAEVVMQTGDYYPDIWHGTDPKLKAYFDDYQWLYMPGTQVATSSVCHYAPGVLAIVVIPKSQHAEPRADWARHGPLPVGILQGYDAQEAQAAAITALLNEGTEPDAPAPLPQDRHIALCNALTGALIYVSPTPFHTSTGYKFDALLEPGRFAKNNICTAQYNLSCVELGSVNALTGGLLTHGVLMISIRQPDHPSYEDTDVLLTFDCGVTVKPVCKNRVIPMHYLGTALQPAEIGVTTGNKAFKSLRKPFIPN
jgi:hypothetical protein